MDLLASSEAAEKMGKLFALTDAIGRALDAGELKQYPSGKLYRKYTPAQAVALQNLQEQRRALQATMKLRLVQ